MLENDAYKEAKGAVTSFGKGNWRNAGKHVSKVLLAGGLIWFFNPADKIANNLEQSQGQGQHQETNLYANLSPDNLEGAQEKDLSSEESWLLGQGIVRERRNGVFTGYYCATPRKNFDTSEIWLLRTVGIGDLITFRVSVKRSTNESDFSQKSQEPKVIAVYGKEMYYRIFFPDTDNRRVLFEDSSVEPPKRKHEKLDYPLVYTQDGETEFEFSVQSLQTNHVFFRTKVTYIADVIDENERDPSPVRSQVAKDFDFQADVPWPNSKNSLEKEFGLGAYPGTCFKILNATVSSE